MTEDAALEQSTGTPNVPVNPVFEGIALNALTTGVDKTPLPTIYHYTDSAGFMGIVSNGAFWLTDAQFLNDGSEISYGNAVADAALRKLGAKAPQYQRPFIEEVRNSILTNRPRYRPAVFCSSTRDNLLNQWRDYGREVVSYSIGLSVNDLIRLDNATFSVMGARMIYQQSKQRRIFDAAVRGVRQKALELRAAGKITAENRNAIVAEAAMEVARVLYWFKNPGFEAEDEVRLMQDIPAILQAGQQPSFRSSRLGIVPYFQWRWDRSEHRRLPITSVTVGPSPHGEIAADAAKVFLNQNGYDVPVFFSTIPIRR